MSQEHDMHLTLLYTAQIRGNLSLLPRYHSYLQQIKMQDDDPILLLDIGGACTPEIWHCDVTKGRSTLIVMDAMGYHAVNVETYLGKGQHDVLKNAVTMGLVDQQHLWRYNVPPLVDNGIVVAAAPAPALTLCIIAASAQETRIHQRTLTLQGVEQGQIGRVRINVHQQTIIEQKILTLPEGIRPDPTISATVDFVEEEAHFLQKRQE